MISFITVLDPVEQICQKKRAYDKNTLIRLRDSPLSQMRPKKLPGAWCIRANPLREENLPTRLRKPGFLQVTSREINLYFEAHLDVVYFYKELVEEVVYPGKRHRISLL